MFSCAPECSKQLYCYEIYCKLAGVMWRRISAEISPKAASEKAQTAVSGNRYTSPKIDVFGRPFYQQCMGVIFGTPGTTYLCYSLAVLSNV